MKWRDNELIVMPYIDEYDDIPRLDDIPDTRIEIFDALGPAGFEDVIYHINDHGNVDCCVWNGTEYVIVWSIV